MLIEKFAYANTKKKNKLDEKNQNSPNNSNLEPGVDSNNNHINKKQKLNDLNQTNQEAIANDLNLKNKNTNPTTQAANATTNPSTDNDTAINDNNYLFD